MTAPISYLSPSFVSSTRFPNQLRCIPVVRRDSGVPWQAVSIISAVKFNRSMFKYENYTRNQTGKQPQPGASSVLQEQDNAAATEREKTKIRKYAELNAINPAPINYQFWPVVAESFGSWSEAAFKITVRIAKSQATVIGLAGHIAVERLFQRLSVTLQKFNPSMILNRSPITA
jgi:hypothetical protein